MEVNGVSKSGPNIADGPTDSYLSQLLSYSLDTFNKEPQSLRNQQDHLRVEITDTAVAHYKGFINAASSFTDISKHVEQVHLQLHSLVDDMKQLNATCSSFATHAASIQDQRKQTRALLSQHGTVLELLEVPQLIDTCVRNGNYDEALDLMAFMNKVGFVHTDVPIVKSLLKEVKVCSKLLLEQLLARLSSNIMLPESLRSISYIRRLATFSEVELRQRFLQCRQTWLQSVVDGVNDSNPADYIRQLTDVHRLHLFDIVMQYRAIFSEGNPASKTASSTDSQAASNQVQSASRILYGWAQNRIQVYIDTVEKHFARIDDGNSLAAVIEACMYCGGSLSRVGLDFRGILLPVFSSAVLRIFEQGTGKAVLMFATALENHKWTHMPLAQRRPQPQSQDANGAPVADDLASAYCLLEHPPLAVLANGMISALNSIRSVALLRVSAGAAELMQSAMRHACGMLAHHGSLHRFTEAEVPVHAHACRAMCDVVCPLLTTMFRQVFSPAATQPDLNDCIAMLQTSTQPSASAHSKGCVTETASASQGALASGTGQTPGRRRPSQERPTPSRTMLSPTSPKSPARARESTAASSPAPRATQTPPRGVAVMPQSPARPESTSGRPHQPVFSSAQAPTAQRTDHSRSTAAPASPRIANDGAQPKEQSAAPPTSIQPQSVPQASEGKAPVKPASATPGFAGFGDPDEDDDDDDGPPEGW